MASPDKGDFPYLSPMAGSKFRGGGRDPGPFWVTPKGGRQPEMVAQGSLHRGYALAGLSYALFLTEYRDALTKAGWEIVDQGVEHALACSFVFQSSPFGSAEFLDQCHGVARYAKFSYRRKTVRRNDEARAHILGPPFCVPSPKSLILAASARPARSRFH
jgi:hypothetical protein